MNTNHGLKTHADDTLPEDLLALAAGLDLLGAQARDEAPADFETRLAQATAEGLIAPAPVVGRIGPRVWSMTPMRIAAGLGLAALVGAAAVAQRNGIDTATDHVVARASVSDWMLMAAVWEETGTGGVSSLVRDASEVSTLMGDTSMEWLLGEGTM